MTKRRAPKSVSLLILGAGGDLTKRLLLPGLASLLSEHDYDVQVIGAAREQLTDQEWRKLIRDSFAKITDPQGADRRLESARYFTGDVTDAGQLETLIAACDHTPRSTSRSHPPSRSRCVPHCAGSTFPTTPDSLSRSRSAPTFARPGR